MTNITRDSGSMSFIGDPVDQTARFVFIIIGSVMILSAIIGNSTLIAVAVNHFKRSRQRSLHDLFIANLAFDDLLTLGYWFTFFVLDLALGYHPVVNASHCVANGMMIVMFTAVNILSLLSISFNRYLHVCHSHLYHRIFTSKSTLVYCLLTWVLGLVVALPPLWKGAAGSYHYNTRSHICSFNRKGFTYPKVIMILCSVLLLFVVMYFNLSIFRFWRKARMSLSIRYPLAKKQHKSRNVIGKWRAGINKLRTLPESRGAESTQTGGIQLRYPNSPELVTYSRHATTELSDGLPIDTEETAETTACSSDVIIEEKDQDSSVATPAAASSTSAVAATSTNASPTSVTRSVMSSTITTSTIESPSTPPAEASMTATSTSMAHEPLSHPSKYGEEQPQTTTASYSQQKRLRKSHAREVRFVRSLIVVCILMFIVFVPFAVVVLIDIYPTKLSPEIIMGANSLLFFNNAINWVVYGMMNPAFKKIYVKWIQRVFAACRRSNRTRADAAPEHSK